MRIEKHGDSVVFIFPHRATSEDIPLLNGQIQGIMSALSKPTKIFLDITGLAKVDRAFFPFLFSLKSLLKKRGLAYEMIGGFRVVVSQHMSLITPVRALEEGVGKA